MTAADRYFVYMYVFNEYICIYVFTYMTAKCDFLLAVASETSADSF